MNASSSSGVAPVFAAYKGAAGPDVLAFAHAWSEASKRPLTVVTVYPGPAPVGMGRVDSEWVAYNREEAQKLLADAKASLGNAVSAEFLAVPADSASHGLNDVMETAGAGALIVMGSRNTKGTRRTAPGSTADRLLQGAPGPVAIVPWDYEEFATPIRRISVAYIGTPDGEAALTAGEQLAEEVGAQLELVSVLPDTSVHPSLGEPAVFREEQRKQFSEGVTSAAARVGATVRLLEGPVVDALADLRPDDTDLLVCGSRGYGPARRVLLGGVSSKVLKHSRVPVIVVPRR
jgi:nucleotide-binding universal stress UspA family protein